MVTENKVQNIMTKFVHSSQCLSHENLEN